MNVVIALSNPQLFTWEDEKLRGQWGNPGFSVPRAAGWGGSLTPPGCSRCSASRQTVVRAAMRAAVTQASGRARGRARRRCPAGVCDSLLRFRCRGSGWIFVRVHARRELLVFHVCACAQVCACLGACVSACACARVCVCARMCVRVCARVCVRYVSFSARKPGALRLRDASPASVDRGFAGLADRRRGARRPRAARAQQACVAVAAG